MIERSVQMDGTSGSSSKRAIRPTDLPTENRRRMRHGEFTRHSQKKVIA